MIILQDKLLSQNIQYVTYRLARILALREMWWAYL